MRIIQCIEGVCEIRSIRLFEEHMFVFESSMQNEETG